ncbi:MAG: phage portal protein, partial [Defluviitaleaceae bacterium]|nr:phage portal protein [Defluviitaleaceae bacterium]
MSHNMEAIHSRLRDGGYAINSDFILEMIAEHDTEVMLKGVRYYQGYGDITKREMYYYDSNKQRVTDETKTNKKLVNNWHKLLVDQKVSYLVGRPMVFSIDSGQLTPDNDFADKIELLLGDEWDDVVADIATNTSNKGTEWLHVYIDRQGYFKYAIAPAEEVIPVYESALQKNLEAVLRYYSVRRGGKDRYRAEWWTRETVTVYIEGEDGGFVLDTAEAENPAPHYNHGTAPSGWGKVPFIEFPNNSFRASDITVTKTLVDEYDEAFSDFANNNAEVQEVIMVLKGYESTDLATFKQNLAYYKAIKLRADNHSGVDKLELSIPVEAKKELLDRLEENIFMFGQGVNIKTDRFGNSPSGASLEFLYTSLDLKASMMERKFRRSVKRLLWFTTSYINMEFGKNYDSNNAQASFRRNMVLNNKEIVETLKASRDMISDESIVSLHPMVENTNYEYQKLLEQREGRADKAVDLTKVNIHE